MSNRFFQSLEGRTMLSVSPTDNPLLAADLAQLQADQQKLKSDRETATSTLNADRAKVLADRNAVEDAKKDARTQFETDKKAMADALAADRAAGQPVRDTWLPVLYADLAAIKQDAGNPDALAADKA